MPAFDGVQLTLTTSPQKFFALPSGSYDILITNSGTGVAYIGKSSQMAATDQASIPIPAGAAVPLHVTVPGPGANTIQLYAVAASSGPVLGIALGA